MANDTSMTNIQQLNHCGAPSSASRRIRRYSSSSDTTAGPGDLPGGVTMNTTSMMRPTMHYSGRTDLHPHLPELNPADRSDSPGAGGSLGVGGQQMHSVGAIRTAMSSGSVSSAKTALGVMVMVYGSAEACARIGGCGLSIVHPSKLKSNGTK